MKFVTFLVIFQAICGFLMIITEHNHSLIEVQRESVDYFVDSMKKEILINNNFND